MNTPRFQPRPTRSAFALPLVVMLITIASLVVALLVSEQATAGLSVSRHVHGYQNHHDAAGIREIASRWLSTARGQLDSMIDPDGLAFRIEFSRSGSIDVRMRDGQGPCLLDTSVLSGRARTIVARMIELIKDEQADLPEAEREPDQPLFRPAGPASISFRSAPIPVLRALIFAVVDDERKARRAVRIAVGRDTFLSERFPVKNFIAALREQDLSPQEINDIETMLTDRNSLWFITAETTDDAGRLAARSGGLYEAEERKTSDPFNQNAGFLTWDALPLE